MLTDRASIAFEEGHSDGIRGRKREFPGDSAYLAGYCLGWTELIGSQHAKADRISRYLAIVDWARARYTIEGRLIMTIGGKPSVYTRIERAAARKYLGV